MISKVRVYQTSTISDSPVLVAGREDGTRKVVRTLTNPSNPFEAAADTTEMFVPKEIIDRRIQDISAGPNKGRKADHYLVVWEGYPVLL